MTVRAHPNVAFVEAHSSAQDTQLVRPDVVRLPNFDREWARREPPATFYEIAEKHPEQTSFSLAG